MPTYYGMLWPAAIYDGEAAPTKYRAKTEAAARQLGFPLELRPEPIYTFDEAGRWTAEACAAKPDGLFVILLDGQEHAWPTAVQAPTPAFPASFSLP